MPLPLYTSNGKFPLGGLRAIDGSHHVCQAGSLGAARCVAGDSRPFKRESRVTRQRQKLKKEGRRKFSSNLSMRVFRAGCWCWAWWRFLSVPWFWRRVVVWPKAFSCHGT